jgi:hypothetical protein
VKVYGHSGFPFGVDRNKHYRVTFSPTKTPAAVMPERPQTMRKRRRHTSKVCRADKNAGSSGYDDVSKATFLGITAREGLHGAGICIREVRRLP